MSVGVHVSCEEGKILESLLSIPCNGPEQHSCTYRLLYYTSLLKFGENVIILTSFGPIRLMLRLYKE